MQEAELFQGLDHGAVRGRVAQQTAAAARMRLPDRSQVTVHYGTLEELLPEDHPARIIWQVVCRLDLSGFQEAIGSREDSAGRPANDVRVMVGLWLWAAVQGVGSGRELAQLCQDHVAYRWMCGGLSVNYHTLNDFRTGHQTALDQLFTQVLGRLMHQGLVSITRITQDGMRVRASAGSGSFKRRQTLEKCLQEAGQHVRELKAQQEALAVEARSRRAAAQEFAVRDRLERVQGALEALSQVEAAKSKQTNKKKREAAARASITDPDARKMKMPNGGFNAAYNVQLASDPKSRAIVGVQVSQSGGDAPLSEPMRQQVQKRAAQSGQEQAKVREQLLDGGYVNLDVIDRADEAGVRLYMPVPEPNKEGIDRFMPRQDDSVAVAQWRERMASEAAAAIYRQRASTSETINGDLRTYRGLERFLVRGLMKVTCVALWSALAYNLMHFGQALLEGWRT